MRDEDEGLGRIAILREINRLADRVIALLAYAGERHAAFVGDGYGRGCPAEGFGGGAPADGYGKI